MLLTFTQAFCLILAPGLLALAPTIESPSELDSGYRQMYNLQFQDAHQTFRTWEQLHPDDPLGPTSDAAAYLFSEFDRLEILQSDLFLDDGVFVNRRRPKPDPATKHAFELALTRGERLANQILARDPRNRDALFAQVLNLGLRADYTALIEKRDLAALSYTKRAGFVAERLLAVDPACYDAYLAIGFENYILGSNPAPVRWLLRLYGAQTDKDEGIRKLRLTAEKGHYLLPFARLLLAVGALRDRDRNEAREILRGLAREFPNNRLYAQELARLQ